MHFILLLSVQYLFCLHISDDVSEALMLAFHTRFFSCLCNVCSQVSEALMLDLRSLSCSLLNDVSYCDFRALTYFTATIL